MINSIIETPITYFIILLFSIIFAFIELGPYFVDLCTTSRIKTVRGGELDCPKNNQLSNRAPLFDSRQVLALFLYTVVASALSNFVVFAP